MFKIIDKQEVGDLKMVSIFGVTVYQKIGDCQAFTVGRFPVYISAGEYKYLMGFRI